MLGKFNPINQIGGRMGDFEEDFERETPITSAASIIASDIKQVWEAAPSAFFETTSSLAKDTLSAGKELFGSILPAKGSVEVKGGKSTKEDQKQAETANGAWMRSIMVENARVVSEKVQERKLNDLVRMEVMNMTSGERNQRLKLNVDLKKEYTENPYHMANLMRQRKEEVKKMVQERKSQEMVANTRSNLMNMNAQEGQSMVSASGAIMSAG
ncbi:MAG: hypothetical protein HYW45_03805 [Candidatus Daviesbacteria bacterium]|nr:MAG: hypothetical protein HYW45_03805 [Candidatus Daviesbacteria bacterium]